MAGTTTFASDLDYITLEMYPEGAQYWNQLDQEAVLLDLIETSPDIPFGGKSDGRNGYTFPVRHTGSANPSVPVSTGQSSTGLPAPGKQEGDVLKFRNSSMWQSIEMEGTVMDSVTSADQAAVVDGLAYEMENQIADTRSESNKWMHGNGGGGIAIPSNVAGTDTLTVDDSSRLQVGRQISIITDQDSTTLWDGQTTGNALVVSAVNSATEVELQTEAGGAPGLTNGAVTGYTVYPYGSQGGAINGLGIICSDADPTDWGDPDVYFGDVEVDAGANEWWKAYRTDAGSSVVSIQKHIQPHLNNMKRRATPWLKAEPMGQNKGVKLIGVSGYDNWQAIANALMSDQRTAASEKIIKNTTGIMYQGVFFVIDDDAPPSAIRLFSPKQLRRYVHVPWHFENKGGGIWRMRSASDGRDADIWRAYKLSRQQLFTVRRIAMGEIHTLSANI